MVVLGSYSRQSRLLHLYSKFHRTVASRFLRSTGFTCGYSYWIPSGFLAVKTALPTTIYVDLFRILRFQLTFYYLVFLLYQIPLLFRQPNGCVGFLFPAIGSPLRYAALYSPNSKGLGRFARCSKALPAWGAWCCASGSRCTGTCLCSLVPAVRQTTLLWRYP